MTMYFGDEWNQCLDEDGVGRCIVFPIKIRSFLKWTRQNCFVRQQDGILQPKRRVFVEMVRVYIRKINC